jgi:peroxiredoxin
MAPVSLVPREKVPALSVPLVDAGTFTLGERKPESFDLLVFYRGLHCPLCAKYLLELERLAPEFAAKGVNIVAISSDDQERGQKMAEKIQAKGVKFAYGLALPVARSWGLYISQSKGQTSIGIEEPAKFIEPAVYLVKPDGTLYYGAVQTMPFARPQFQDLLGAVGFALDKNYPARGEYVGAL